MYNAACQDDVFFKESYETPAQEFLWSLFFVENYMTENEKLNVYIYDTYL